MGVGGESSASHLEVVRVVLVVRGVTQHLLQGALVLEVL